MPPAVTVIPKALEFTSGVVVNVKAEPPFTGMGVMDDDEVDATTKSLAIPVVGPAVPKTLIVQLIAPPTRCGEDAAHRRVEALVGVPKMVNDRLPLEITAPPTLAVTMN